MPITQHLYLYRSRESLLSSLDRFDDFNKVAGLGKLNDRKTEGLWMSASIGNDKILLTGKELK